MSEYLKIRAQSAPWNQAVEIFLYKPDVDGGGGRQVVTGFTFELQEVATAMSDDMLQRLSTDDAQTLMDDLWNAGLRPTEGTGSAGSLRATEKHLEDMRGMTTKLLDKVLRE